MPPLTEQEWTPDRRELMRLPTLLVLPDGHRCDAPGWHAAGSENTDIVSRELLLNGIVETKCHETKLEVVEA